MKKKVTAYSLDQEVIDWVKMMALLKDRSSSYVVNSILRKAKEKKDVRQRVQS